MDELEIIPQKQRLYNSVLRYFNTSKKHTNTTHPLTSQYFNTQC